MRIVFLILTSVMIMTATCQSVSNRTAGGSSPVTPLAIDQSKFGEKFSILYNSEGDYDYYVVDMTKFKDRFERIYFVVLSYHESKIVVIDSDVDRDQFCYKTFYQNKEAEIACVFNDLKEQTTQAGQTMTANEKSAWLTRNDKFKNHESHE